MKKRTLILGFGVSGQSSAEVLLKRGCSVLALDQKAASIQMSLSERFRERFLLQHDESPVDFSFIDSLIVSPGIAPSHPVIRQAKAAAIPIWGEVAWAIQFLSNRMIGVTGTNGKTTVVLLIEHVIRSVGWKARAIGNVGTSVSSYLLEQDPKSALASPDSIVREMSMPSPDMSLREQIEPALQSSDLGRKASFARGSKDILIIELSSYQLETLQTPCLDGALLLNITPDHLDRYASMEEYARAKCQIASCLKKDGLLFASRAVLQDYGHFLSSARCFETKIEDPIERAKNMRLGMPEWQNIQAAQAICSHLGISEEQFQRALLTFHKPKHRIEFVGEWNGILFYDDSKATNVDSVTHAIGLFEGPVIILAGGVHKGASYKPWIPAFQGKVERVVVFGQAASMIEADLKESVPVERFETLAEAVCSAVRKAQKSVTILLSPGCSSFDQFRNYEHRGNEFKRMFEEKVWIEKKRS